MKDKIKFDYNSDEKSIIIKSITMLRNELLSQERDVAVIDDILLKFSDGNRVELDIYEYKIVIGALNDLRTSIKEQQQSPIEVSNIILRMIDENSKKKVLSRILRKETSFVNKILPVLISFMIILLYYLWNKHLAAENGTLFLGELIPAKNWDDFVYRFTKTKNNWLYHYFTNIHYWIFAAVILASLSFYIYNSFRKKKDDVSVQKTATLSLWWLCGIMMLGNIIFFIAMIKQFQNHDYYFIDSFFLPILLLLILLLNKLPEISNYKQGILAVLVTAFLIFFMLKDVKGMQVKRRAIWRGPDSERTIKNYQGSEQYLDSLNISNDAKILTLYAYPQNAAFIMMNRKGYTAMFDKHDMVKNGLTFDYDYLIIENEILKKKLKENKEFLSDLKYYSDNGKITLFVKNE